MKTAPQIFDFEDRDLRNLVVTNLKLFRGMKTAFNYVYDALVKQGNHYDLSASKIDLDTASSNKGKNYNWMACSTGDIEGSVEFIIRQYGLHQTLYYKLTSVCKYKGMEDWKEFQYGCLTFNTDTKSMDGKEHDLHYDYPFMELNAVMPNLIKLITDDKVHGIWNDLMFPIPKYCEVKTAFYGDEIRSYDLLVFCAEELSTINRDFFAETDMMTMLKSIDPEKARGTKLGQGNITSIITEFPKAYSDPYYHGVGIMVQERKDYKRIYDVYSLTEYYLENVHALMSL